MADTIDAAVRALMAASSDAARQLAKRPVNSPVFQQVYNRVAAMVLAESESNLTPAQRALVAQFMTLEIDPDVRVFLLRVRLTESERATLQRMADEAGTDMSEVVRRRVFGDA